MLAIQKEHGEKADIYFEFEEIKFGRKVRAIRFFVKKIVDAVADKKMDDSLVELPQLVNENTTLLD